MKIQYYTKTKQKVFLFLIIFVLLATSLACGFGASGPMSTPTSLPSTPTPVPPTATPAPPSATPTPEPPTATPTPSYPSFSKDEALEIPSISVIVGEGRVVFGEGEEAGKLRVEINGKIPIVEGYWCLCCVDTIRIEPNLKVPISPFFLDTEAPPPPQGLISDYMEVNFVLSSPIADDATEFIVSGPEGATLTKVGQGFLLVDGEAYFLQIEIP